jgi:hypothetical protein
LGLNGSLSGWHFFVVMICLIIMCFFVMMFRFFVVMIRVFMNSSFAAMSVGVTTV